MGVDGILHATVPVTDLSRSVEFYETVLEARAIGPDAEDATRDTASAFWFEVGPEQYLRLTSESTDEEMATLAFATEETALVGLRARLDAMGRSYRESTTNLAFEDPDGNRLEVTTWDGPP
jgi:catechol 2,3-dioxygenase-like lactoylglutathione lyase family enzyme